MFNFINTPGTLSFAKEGYALLFTLSENYTLNIKIVSGTIIQIYKTAEKQPDVVN